MAFAFGGGAGQEKSLFADDVFHWVTVTAPPPKCETEFNAPFLPFAPGIASDGKDAPARLVVYLRRDVRP